MLFRRGNKGMKQLAMASNEITFALNRTRYKEINLATAKALK